MKAAYPLPLSIAELTVLSERVGHYHLTQRIIGEYDREADPFRRRQVDEAYPWFRAGLRLALQATGLWRRGLQNALTPVVTRNEVVSPRLPAGFDGFSLLQLSDLHIGDDPDLLDAIINKIKTLEGGEYSACIFTGDFRAGHGQQPALADMIRALTDVIDVPCYAILGNHDSLSLVPPLEALGVRVLLNESLLLHQRGDEICLAGVDDYHWFRLANLERALHLANPARFTILLNHSPEQYRHAAYADVDLYLAGHTHGGQICLPLGKGRRWAPKMNIECRRSVGDGVWQFRQMQGYTSRGLGTSLLPVRFNCPPELVIHTLRCATGE